MSSDRLPLFRIRRGWRAGGLVLLAQPPDVQEAARRHPSTLPPTSRPQNRNQDRQWNGNHRIDLRASIPLPGGRWYVTIVAGPERRSAERLRQEGQTDWLRRTAIYIVLMALTLWLVVCAVAFVYLMKSALGIDIFDGNSPLHFLWDWIFDSAAASVESDMLRYA